jgi:hypothetical protein
MKRILRAIAFESLREVFPAACGVASIQVFRDTSLLAARSFICGQEKFCGQEEF